jgi:hypothetical protein
MDALSVNAALAQLSELADAYVTLIGALSLEFEGQCINHVPRSECLGCDEWGRDRSSIWVDFDLEAIGHDEQWLKQFDRRHVRVSGILKAPEPAFGGCGHFSLWPAELMIEAISKK